MVERREKIFESVEVTKNAADAALEASDARVLHRLFEQKCDEIEKLVAGYSVMLSTSDDIRARPVENEGAVLAIRDIAMEAIKLADGVAKRSTAEDPPVVKEMYPPTWRHCEIHLNPETGEMHSDGDHSVRHWIEEQMKKASDD